MRSGAMTRAWGLLLALAAGAGAGAGCAGRPAAPAAGTPPWPGSGEALLFCCPNAIAAARAQDLDGKSVSEFYYEIQPRGLAVCGPHSAMRFEGGAYVAPDVNQAFAAAFRARSRLTLEALAAPFSLQQTGPAEIVSFASTPEDGNFRLAQEKDRLVFRLRTSGPQAGWIELCRLAGDRPRHVLVTYAPGRLVCYCDGARVFESDRVQGDLSGWQPRPLVMGNNWTSRRPWRGLLEGVALYARELGADEARAHYRAWRARLAARRPVPRIEVQARLLKKSDWPEPRSQTYSMARSLFEYQVEKVSGGTCAARTVLVTHYIWADFKLLEPAGLRVGQSRRLLLEPYAQHPELEDIRAYETLELDPDAPIYFDAGPLVLLRPEAAADGGKPAAPR